MIKLVGMYQCRNQVTYLRSERMAQEGNMEMVHVREVTSVYIEV